MQSKVKAKQMQNKMPLGFELNEWTSKWIQIQSYKYKSTLKWIWYTKIWKDFKWIKKDIKNYLNFKKFVFPKTWWYNIFMIMKIRYFVGQISSLKKHSKP